jgi:hypothetical protein
MVSDDNKVFPRLFISQHLRVTAQLLFPPRRARPRARKPTIWVHVATQHLRRASILRLDIDVLELQTRTRRALTAVYAGGYIVSVRHALSA